MSKLITNIPVASRTFKGLSDIGYTFEAAVADLIDNSITQGSAEDIIIVYDKNESGLYLRVYDNGIGMSRDKLFDAMTIGSSEEDYKDGDLSKYGLGMKTASVSQCNVLTVLSKGASDQVASFSWDMNVIASKGWKVVEYDASEINTKQLFEFSRLRGFVGDVDILKSDNWTLVCWDFLNQHDKEYKSKKTEQARDRFIARKLDVLKIYLRTVFHRFLSGENGARKIAIYLNGERIQPFDPFCRNEKNTILDPFYDNEGDFYLEEEIHPIKISRYILPTKEGERGFSNLNNWKLASGYLNWNDAQGYYVYRNNRLIDFGGWFGVKGKDEHEKLARVSIDLSDRHDPFFKLDVKKSSIQFPDDFKYHLTEKVNKDYINRAKARYKKSEKKIPIIKNKLRTNSVKVDDLSKDLVTSNEIKVTESISEYGTQIQVANPDGGFTEKDLVYRQLDPKLRIAHSDFGTEEIFWKMIPGPGNFFQILLNESHPFYEKIYLKAADNKVATSSVDALLYSLAFIELRFKTEANRTLFVEINEVVSDILNKIIEKRLL